MRKTKGITKYELEWQLIRSSIKGNKTPLEEKLLKVEAYYLETCTYDRWERVYNWLEGLKRGYKASNSIEHIYRVSEEINRYNELRSSTVEKESYIIDQQRDLHIVKNTSEEALLTLWKDLFKANQGWLLKGYNHEGCNEFMDQLFVNGILYNRVSLKQNYSMEKLLDLRKGCSLIKNHHKFFF